MLRSTCRRIPALVLALAITATAAEAQRSPGWIGIGFELWTFVIGHGVIELTVIFIAGGSGLMLGWAILRPGLMRRRDALALAARKAVYLLLGAVPWLVVAGTIEGFISPNEDIPIPVKWAVGIGSGIVLYSYLLFAGRETKKKH